MEELERKLNYAFRDAGLLRRALCHSSYANEHRAAGAESNERLEFLGDSVLGFVAADYLFTRYPEKPEGDLTRERAALVCEESLYDAAKRLDLGRYLCLGRGEDAGGGRKNQSILADAVEAVIAAVYLDGGLESASALVRRLIPEWETAAEARRDYKTELQERVQRQPGREVTYQKLEEHGPDHAKVFIMEALVNGEALGRGSGRSKKEAEQAAARAALEALSPENGSALI